jgi:predicted NBD/HSP70 family sugar kinase
MLASTLGRAGPIEKRGGAGPVDQTSVRRHNLGLVLQHVATHGPRSRARIAAETGLNKTTVSSLVAELVERGLLREAGLEDPGLAGRPGLRLELSGDSIATLGLEINVDYLAACATDLAGRIRHRAFLLCDNRIRTPERVISDLATLTRGALDVLASQDLEPVGATVALPGLVDLAGQTLLVAPNLGWTETPVAALLADRLGRRAVPIRVGNDADLGALGESWAGVGRHLRDFVFVYGAIGVGAGIVVGGELLRGASGFGGELGHVTVDRYGPRCACGNTGCLELYVGRDALLRRAGMTVPTPNDGTVRWPALLADRARAGDARALEALAEVRGWLSIGLGSLANLFNPSAIVLGGYFAPLGEWLVQGIEPDVGVHVLGARWSSCRVLVSRVGEEAAVRGAATLVLHEVLADPGSVHLRRRTASRHASAAPAR